MKSFLYTCKKQPRKARKCDLHNFDKCVIHLIIHNLYKNKEILIISSLLRKLKNDTGFDGNRSTLHKILKDIGFRWRWNGRKFLIKKLVIMEKHIEN